MRIVNVIGGFHIARGSEKPQFFSFLVDDDSACWSQRTDNARTFLERDDALKGLAELKRRDKLKRERRNQYR